MTCSSKEERNPVKVRIWYRDPAGQQNIPYICTMEKVASIIKYKDSDQVVKWLGTLPKKLAIEDVEILLRIAKNGKYLLWTERHGVKLLK